MKTIVDPKENIEKLWGMQRNNETDAYRLMRYVLCVKLDDKVLMHNIVTGRLIELEPEEESILDNLPKPYDPKMEQLVSWHYLVPEDYKEDIQVINLRRILLQLNDARSRKGITKYTILPTTACNARCYYCYEKGIATETMTEPVADDVVKFIVEHCNGMKVRIRWFGGEPTLAVNRIDQICVGLKDNGIEFSSTMISNGYLINEDLVRKASDEWNLDSIKISMDGTRNNYNRIKAYVYKDEDPYGRIVRNIGLLLKAGIRVNVFMNFDQNNYQDFEMLLNEFDERFHHHPLLRIRSHQLILDDCNAGGASVQAKEQWYDRKIHELNTKAREIGYLHMKKGLPSLEYQWCEAASGNVTTILPNGKLVSCPEQLAEDQVIGDLKHGITNDSMVRSWREVSYTERCRNCFLFPDCMRIKRCASSGKCFIKSEKTEQYRYNIKQIASELANK